MGQFAKFLSVVVCGLITSVVVAVILGTIQSATGYVLYGYSWWFVLPVGAAVSGVVASMGYNWSAKALDYRPTAALLTAMVGISVATFFLIYWIDFTESNYATTYSNFLTHQLNNTSISIGFKHKDTDFDTPDIDIGAAGYFFALLQIVGFGAGGYVMYSVLKDEAYCDRCETYMKEAGKQTVFSYCHGDRCMYGSISFQTKGRTCPGGGGFSRWEWDRKGTHVRSVFVGGRGEAL